MIIIIIKLNHGNTKNYKLSTPSNTNTNSNTNSHRPTHNHSNTLTVD